jgi:molybdopterin converting factor small subunit
VSEIKSEIHNPKSEMSCVTVEAVAWVTQFVGGDGTRRKIFEETIAPEDTVRTVLRRLSDRFPKLDEALWQRPGGMLAEHIEVLVNDAVLGVTHDLDSPVQPGDRITLLGQYTGG